MRFGRITIHPMGMLLLILVGIACYERNTLMPLFWFSVVMAIMVPLCFWMHRWNEKANEQMLRDFPDDPYIQSKYGKKDRK